ncbi:thioredoxin-like protein [Polyplosphaeria fusca]|uniref:Thioredoxin-like protein n=1 Tax=Polyplosphaeria fusca TaxID=682080 RepID=A0A9P4R352_9PLEO|nr:thioredoxin-like protein [Polyplosphaeria fusca]
MTSSAAHDELNELLRDKGKETRHPEDRDDHDSDHDHNDAGPDHYPEKPDTDDELDIPADMRSNYFLPKSIHSDANTGPKGVIADAHAFEMAKRQSRRSFWRKSSAPNTYNVATYHDEKAASSEDEGEDSFLRRWRENRLRDLHNGLRSRTASPSKRIPAVDDEGYLNAIENVKEDKVVVVFIYDDRSEISSEVEKYMTELYSMHYRSTNFVKYHYEDAEIGVAGVPAVLAYRNQGEQFADLVPLLDELPHNAELSAASLEKLFYERGILSELRINRK